MSKKHALEKSIDETNRLIRVVDDLTIRSRHDVFGRKSLDEDLNIALRALIQHAGDDIEIENFIIRTFDDMLETKDVASLRVLMTQVRGSAVDADCKNLAKRLNVFLALPSMAVPQLRFAAAPLPVLAL